MKFSFQALLFFQATQNKVDQGKWSQDYADWVLLQRYPQFAPNRTNATIDHRCRIRGGGPKNANPDTSTPKKAKQSKLLDFHFSPTPNKEMPIVPVEPEPSSEPLVAQEPSDPSMVVQEPSDTSMVVHEPGDTSQYPASSANPQEVRQDIRANITTGAIVDPLAKGQGWTMSGKHGRPKGRTTGRVAGFTANHREPGGAILRQDKTAPEKLYIIYQIEAKCKELQVESWSQLPVMTKVAMCKRFQIRPQTVVRIIPRKLEYQQFLTAQRLTMTGVRPFGTLQMKAANKRKSQGARMRKGPSEIQQPLHQVLQRVRVWFQKERTFGHEIFRSHIHSRLHLELKREIGNQVVLQQKASEHYNQAVHDACQERVDKLADPIYMDRQGHQWARRALYPAIGAHARKATKLSHQPEKFDKVLAHLTWQTMDYTMWIIQNGSHEELSNLVADPESFQDNAKSTTIVAFDETPIWGKLRGEEAQFLSQLECDITTKRRRLSRKSKDSNAAPEQRTQARQELLDHMDQNSQHKQHVFQQVSQGGDKYRLTMVTFQVVQDWFDPTKTPKGSILPSIVIVPSAFHARLEDITPDGKWAREVMNKNRGDDIQGIQAMRPRHW